MLPAHLIGCMLVAIISDMLMCSWEVIVWLIRLACAAEDVALTTNQNFVRDFPVAYDILFENISDQARHCHYILTSFALMYLLWTVLMHL